MFINQSAFNNTIEQIRERFRLKAEIPFRDYAVARELIAEAEVCAFRPLEVEQVRQFAFSLKSKALDNIWHSLFLLTDISAYPGDIGNTAYNILLEVLKIRITKRIFMVGWYSYQYAYTSKGIIEGIKIGLAALKGSVFEEEGEVEDYLSLFKETLLNNDSAIIKEFIVQKHLLKASPFTKELCRLYFEECTGDAFLLNSDDFIDILDDYEVDRVVASAGNYLKSMDVYAYLEDVNLKIIDKLGQPKLGIDYHGIPSKSCEKLRRWHILRTLGMFYDGKEIKYQTFSAFYNYMVDITLADEENLVIIDFGFFVVIDGKQMMNFSYIYEKQEFERMWGLYDPSSGVYFENWLIPEKSIPEARDAMIEEISDYIYRLVFIEFGKLYARDLLRELLINKIFRINMLKYSNGHQ